MISSAVGDPNVTVIATTVILRGSLTSGALHLVGIHRFAGERGIQLLGTEINAERFPLVAAETLATLGDLLASLAIAGHSGRRCSHDHNRTQ
jgi:hypothetical protein